MFDGLEVEANEIMGFAKAFGCYNIRFKAYAEHSVEYAGITPDFACCHSARKLFTADHDTEGCQENYGLGNFSLSDTSISVYRKTSRVQIGQRPYHLRYGSEQLDLIEDDSVVYVVVPSEHEGNLPSLLEEHPEWTGRVQVIVITFESVQYGQDWWDSANYILHGAGAPKEGTFSSEEMATREFKGKDFYIFNHKVAWKGQVADRDVVADINNLLAGNQLVVKTERVPEVKLPKYEDVERQLIQVRELFRSLSKVDGMFQSCPKLEFIGTKVFSDCSPPAERFTCRFSCFFNGSPYAETIEKFEEYTRLLEVVTQLFPYVQHTPMPMRRPEAS
jgi:hypothetical protein